MKMIAVHTLRTKVFLALPAVVLMSEEMIYVHSFYNNHGTSRNLPHIDIFLRVPGHCFPGDTCVHQIP